MPEAALERLCRRPSLIAAPSSFPTEPQTLHVYEGDSWDTALGEANAGDCIVIHPGLHKERVVIRKSGITIRGVDAASVKMHVRHADSAVTFNMCRNVRFENITVRNETGPGIRIVKAAPTIASCTISGLTGGILVARNAESPGFYPTVQRCNISKCARGPGIALSDARAVVEDCVIQHNSDAGILCEGRSNPWIKGNTVSKGRGAGIALLSQASGVLRDNVIEENTCTGIVIEGGSSPIALRNVIRNGKAEGVKVDGASKARFEGNEFSGNSVCELFVGKGCDVACVRCSFHSGRGVGVSVQEGVVTLKKNTFHSFDAACVSVVGSAGSVIESNVFTIGLQPGIVLGERSGAIVERNEFHVTVPGNTFTTVSAKQSPSLHVADNRVKHVEPRETERPADVLQSETLRRNEVQALFKSPRAADDDEDGDDRLDSGDDSGLDISISGSNYSLSSMTKTGSFFEKTEAGVPDGNGTGISAKRRHSAFAERLLCLAAVNAQGRRRSEGSPLPLPETPPRHHADGLAHPALRPRLSPSASGSGSTAVANLHSAKQHVPGAGSSPTAGNG
ncbi:F-box protein dre-1 [Diplonema papillatum]|nr:F-box protein dre-1 [Diplonema papillatum]